MLSLTVSMKQQPREKTDVKPLPKRRGHFSRSDVLETEAFSDFKFQHKFSLLMVGPTQFGKTWFVEKLITTDRIQYPVRNQDVFGGTTINGRIGTKQSVCSWKGHSIYSRSSRV